MSTTIIDISWPISPAMTSYKNSKPVVFTLNKTFAADNVRDALVTMNTHTGTHVDAPAHFLKDGVTIEQLSLTQLMGPAQVLDLSHIQGAITAADLRPLITHSDQIILLKTASSMRSPTEPFDPNFVYLAADGAQLLVDCGAKAVGIDALGIERNQPGHETHETLLRANIPIIEGLRLGHVASGVYTFLCLPLALHGLEAAPARAILIKN